MVYKKENDGGTRKAFIQKIKYFIFSFLIYGK